MSGRSLGSYNYYQAVLAKGQDGWVFVGTRFFSPTVLIESVQERYIIRSSHFAADD